MNKKMFLGILVVLFGVLMCSNVFAPTGIEYSPWVPLDSGTTADLYGVDTYSTIAYAVGAGGTILYTGDGGQTWSSQTSGTSVDLYDVYESPSAQACVVGASGTILYTNDGGTTWSSVTSGTTEDLHAIHVAGTYASNLIVVGDSETILRSTDYGQTWTDVTGSITGYDANVDLFSVDRINPLTALVAVGKGGTHGGAKLYSFDEGLTWTSNPIGDNFEGVSFQQPHKDYGLVVNDCGSVCGQPVIQKTVDNGITWTTVMPYSPNEYKLRAVDSWYERAWAVGYSATQAVILYSYDKGETWNNQLAFPIPQILNDVHLWNHLGGMAVGNGGVILKYDGTDSDGDLLPDPSDNCPYTPNINQQDLDGDGAGTWCDEDEFDINVMLATPRGDSGLLLGVGTLDFAWGVINNYECTSDILCAIAHGISGFYAGPFAFPYGPDPQTALGVRPLPFGDGNWDKTHDVSYSAAGVRWDDLVSISSVPDCEGGVIGGPISMTGVGYSYGFNASCMQYLRGQPQLEVEYDIVFQGGSTWEVYTDWDTAAVDKTGQSFTVTNRMGVVFVSQPSGRAIRFSLPTLATSGEPLEMDAAQSAAFEETCLQLLAESYQDDPGLVSACEQVALNSVPRGTDVFVGVGHLEVTSTGGIAPAYKIKAVIPGSVLSGVSADTKEMSVSNAVTLAGKDAINMFKTSDFSPRFTWDTDMTVGSYIPVVGTSMEIRGTAATPITIDMVVNHSINLTSVVTLEDALGLGALGSILAISDVHFQAANKPYMGFAFAVSDIDISDSVFDDSVSGFAVDYADVNVLDSTLNTQTLSDISQYFRDIRAKFVQLCSEENTWLLKDEAGQDLEFLLPNGISLASAALGPLIDDFDTYIDCGLHMDGFDLYAGERIGIALIGDGTSNTIMEIIDTTVTDAKAALSVAGIGQNQLRQNVDVTGFTANNAGTCITAAGHLDLSVANSNCYGDASNSGPGISIISSSEGFINLWLADNLYHEPLYATTWNDPVVTITGTTVSGFGTNPNAASYDLHSAMVVYDSTETPSTGTLTLENVVATGNAEDAVFTYGEPDITTVGTTPPIVDVECAGNSAISARVTSNDVQLNNGTPGQQPLSDATVSAYDKTCSDGFPDAFDVVNNCDAISSCTTDSNGECIIECLPAGDYFVVVDSLAHPGKYPSHSVGYLADGETKFARFAFLKDPTGKVNPSKSSRQIGSELWIYEPAYVVWDGTEEYYPFVFETGDDSWIIDVCVDAPSGYAPVDDVECLQTILANEAKSILFQLVETGSAPGSVGVDIDMVDPQGKSHRYRSEVDMRLTEKLAKAKGVAIDKNGRLLKKAEEKARGIPFEPNPSLYIDSVITIILLLVVYLVYCCKRKIDALHKKK